MRSRLAGSAWFLLLAARLVGAAPSDFVGNEAPVALPAPLAAALERIDAGALAEHIAWLAAPEREGRGLGTKGLDATAEYLAAKLRAFGVRTEFQRVPLREVTAPGGSVTLSHPAPRRSSSKPGNPRCRPPSRRR